MKLSRRLRICLTNICSIVFAAALLQPSVAIADVRLPGFFTDHMVLQQQKEIVIWGWATPTESLTVWLGESMAQTQADAQGKWRVNLPAMEATSDPLELKVKGSNEVVLKDVLIGEVWLCSGQSNMEWRVAQSKDAEKEIAAADYPMIRHMKVARKQSTVPLEDIESQWQVCSPETAGEFTACGYYMARELHQELGVPIGLINSSWGGTRVEPWATPGGFAQVSELSELSDEVNQKTPGSIENLKLMDEHIAAIDAWTTKARAARIAGESIEPSPAFPDNLKPYTRHQDPTMLYNAMIHGLVGYPIRGAIWYQGESNHAEKLYTEKKKALINGWRDIWGTGEFPFYYVQIAPFQYGQENPEVLAEFWEDQAAVLAVPNTGMVVVNDIATVRNIHPPNKQEVGHRLALLALKNDYGRDVVASGPVFDSLEILDGKLEIKFSSTGGGLKTRDGKAPDWFEIIGDKSGGFQQATAMIEGDSIILSSDKVESPCAMRFAWHKTAEPNLQGGTGLPCSAFRAGEVPTVLNSIPDIDTYQLVYDLDLSKLGANINYDVNNSSSVDSFDRIGYFVELESEKFGTQFVFTSMDAFTDDVSKIGIPTAASGAVYQQAVSDLDVFSNVDAIKTGTSIATGNIEFWSSNYGPENKEDVQNATGNKFDFGDEPSGPAEGYGSMQVHNFGERQTLFSINHWRNNPAADLGIGNGDGEHPDWTFMGNAETYSTKRLRVFVRAK